MVRQRLLRLPVPSATPFRGLHPPVVHGLPGRRVRATGSGARGAAAAEAGVATTELLRREVREPVQVRKKPILNFEKEAFKRAYGILHLGLSSMPCYTSKRAGQSCCDL